MKRIISCTLLVSLMSATTPWAALAFQPTAKSDSDGIADWGQGVKVRLSKGSEVNVQQSPGKVSASNLKGRFYIKLDGSTKIAIKTKTGYINATRGEFLVDTEGGTKLHVFQGDAGLDSTATDVALPVAAQSWLPAGKEVALQGSDVRARAGEPDEFSKRKDRSKGVANQKVKKKIVPQATQSPPATVTNTTPPEPPQPPPPVTQVPPPPPPEPPPPPPPAIGGGISPWIIVGSLLAVGGIAYGLSTIGGDNSNPTPPASP